jgi:hypothetical protein
MMRIMPVRYGVKYPPFASALYLDGASWLVSPSQSLLSGRPITIDVRTRIGTPSPTNGWCLFGQGETGGASDQEFSITPTTRYPRFLIQSGVAGGTPINMISSTQVPIDEWVLISLELTGSNAYIYLDGNIIASQAYTGYWINTGYNLFIGHETVPGFPASDRFYRGYMDEIRVTDGARYGGANFTPTNEPFSASDPLWGDVVSLLHFDSSLSDETGLIWTPVGSPLVQDAPDNWQQ